MPTPTATRRLTALFAALAAAGSAFAQSATTVLPPVPSPVSSTAQAAATTAAIAAAAAAAASTPAVPAGTITTLPTTPIALPLAVLPPTGRVTTPTAAGETSVTLDIGHGIRFVPPSRVTVPAGETLLISGPSFGGRPVQWLKDGEPLPGATGPLLALHGVRSADAGIYTLVALDPATAPTPSQALILGVGPTTRLLNLSTRGTLAAGPVQSFTAGFVVAAGSGQNKRLILRAVGPTLAAFGVTNPLRAPVLRLYDAAGQPYENGYAYPAVVGGPNYETDLANALAATGAFPIAPGTLDAVVMMPFVAGAYTAHVTSGDQTAGTVLVEIYEVP